MLRNTITASPAVQPKGPILIKSSAMAWGFRDGCQGRSEFDGYEYFVGQKLADYRAGWANGQRVRQLRSN